ncbi:MAG: carbamoyltransferase HypF [Methanocalculaceae archaeon]|jgi:hydrogenase maturation protein HypF|nr:carbamoyltransferase HypF [Methanocalculaceae archaeon]
MYCGRIILRGVVQGVGFRPFVYATAVQFGVRGTVINHGSEVEITACGDRFDEFCETVSQGPKMSIIDVVTVEPLPVGTIIPQNFSILPSADGARTGFIPADIATCDKCLEDILDPKSRYHGYWATSCTDCGPRYSIIHAVPYDRERISMNAYPPCEDCLADYGNPGNRRHHAQTICCAACGPELSLMTGAGILVETQDPIAKTAELLDAGHIVAVRGVGGFHLCCVEEQASRLKQLLGRLHQSLAVMIKPESLSAYVVPLTDVEREMLTGPVHPIMVLDKLEPAAHFDLSELHNLGVMLPYTGLHHLLFERLEHPLLVMTSANASGIPMITETSYVVERMGGTAEFILSHDRKIANRCDDSVVRDGCIIRLSRGLAPLRTAMDLGAAQILGVGPELNANATIYKGGFVVTSPHIGNIRNLPTALYLKETIAKLTDLTGAKPDIIAHDLHPQFFSTKVARELAEDYGAALCPVQHHQAHIASVTTEEVVGIAIDGVGYGSDATIWGGEILTGSPEDGYTRTGHLEQVLMPGGDLAARFPERMLYGILPDDATLELLRSRGWNEAALRILSQQTAQKFNCPATTSMGRALDAVAALLGICCERTYDGEPSMVLEAHAARGTPQPMDVRICAGEGRGDVLMTSELLREGRAMLARGMRKEDVAASVQTALSQGIAELAIRSCNQMGVPKAALSGGVAINRSIRETIFAVLGDAGVPCLINPRYPFGDGCISCGQVVMAGARSKAGKL